MKTNNDTEKPADQIPEIPTQPTEKQDNGEAASSKDIDDVLMILNELDQMAGGKGKIAGIPPELTGSVKFLIEKLITVRDLFEDPLYKDVMDDMHDQRMDGQVPSLLVAVAKSVPMEELIKIAEDEGYEDVQGAVAGRVQKEKDDEEGEKRLYGNFDKSKKNIESYCSKMGYDDARKQKLYARIGKLRDIFADGLVSEEEVGEIDKIDNYDSDIEMMKSRIPEEPVKTVLPDKASINEAMAQTPKPKDKSQSAMDSAGYNQPDYLNTGKRKFFEKKG